VKELTHLAQKVRIIAFLELLFQVDKDERSLSFRRIADHCVLDINDVELLIMKSMSLGLVKGTVDEVE
jgi:26S proteasome regulatory subunit N9